MSNTNIDAMYNELVGDYEDGEYVSRAAIFNRAMWEGKITERERDAACEYYGKLWNYVGD